MNSVVFATAAMPDVHALERDTLPSTVKTQKPQRPQGFPAFGGQAHDTAGQARRTRGIWGCRHRHVQFDGVRLSYPDVPVFRRILPGRFCLAKAPATCWRTFGETFLAFSSFET